jgi:hypothetical protein
MNVNDLLFCFNFLMITIAFYVVHFKIKRLKKEFGEYQNKINRKLELTMQKMDLFEKTGKFETLTQDEIIEVSFDNSILDRRFFYKRLKLYHPNLTEHEKVLCWEFYQEKTALEIATQENSNFSKINERKEKLKFKLGLHKKESLTKYLKGLFN